jgi:hypothetical protein
MHKRIGRGDALENGAVVLARSTMGFVLCYNKVKDEFVVWAMGEDGATFSGDYFKSLESAIKTFKERTGEDHV